MPYVSSSDLFVAYICTNHTRTHTRCACKGERERTIMCFGLIGNLRNSWLTALNTWHSKVYGIRLPVVGLLLHDDLRLNVFASNKRMCLCTHLCVLCRVEASNENLIEYKLMETMKTKNLLCKTPICRSICGFFQLSVHFFLCTMK